MDRKGVETFLADAPPVTVGSHEPLVDGEAGLFADGTLDRVQASFNFLLSDGDHVDASIAGGEMESQPPRQSPENA